MDEIASVISAATAVVATTVSLYLLHQGQQDRRGLQRQREREQASKVTAWADWHSDDFATFAKPRLPAIYVQNASDAVVFDVFVDYRAPIDGVPFRAPIGPVPPGETRQRVIDYDGRLPDGWEPGALFPRVFYRDSAGVYWLRDALGRLRADPGAANDDFYDQGGVLLDR